MTFFGCVIFQCKDQTHLKFARHGNDNFHFSNILLCMHGLPHRIPTFLQWQDSMIFHDISIFFLQISRCNFHFSTRPLQTLDSLTSLAVALEVGWFETNKTLVKLWYIFPKLTGLTGLITGLITLNKIKSVLTRTENPIFQVSSHFSLTFYKILKFYDISMTGKATVIFKGFQVLWEPEFSFNINSVITF